MNKHLNEFASNSSKNQLVRWHTVLLKKGIFLYDYIDSFERFKETEFPTKDTFTSNITENKIGKKYERGLAV